MATGILKCRVCGKEYEACRSARRVDGVYRWQDVACCVEHGAEYLALIRASRAKEAVVAEPTPVDEAYTLLDAEYEDYEDDDWAELDDDASDAEFEIEV